MAYNTGWAAGRGVGFTWTTAGFTATGFNSLASGSVVVATSAIVNTTALDIYADVSFSLVVGGTTTAASYLTLYILPLNQNGSTYGDGTASGTTAPSASYFSDSVGVKPAVASGSAVTGTFRGVILPPQNFLFAIVNNTGIALSSSAAATVSYITYNESLNS